MPRPDQQPFLSANDITDDTPIFTQITNGVIRQIKMSVLKTVISTAVNAQGYAIDLNTDRVVFFGSSNATFTRTTGKLSISVPNPFEFDRATIIVDFDSTDVDSNNEFILEIVDESQSVNTWESTDLTNFDLWIPILQAYQASLTKTVPSAELTSLTNVMSNANQVFPGITYGNGKIQFNFKQETKFSELTRCVISIKR